MAKHFQYFFSFTYFDKGRKEEAWGGIFGAFFFFFFFLKAMAVFRILPFTGGVEEIGDSKAIFAI